MHKRQEAFYWHNDHYEGKSPPYLEWKQKFLERFHDEADIGRLRTKLHKFKQKADQRARSYVASLDSLYLALKGKDIVLSNNADVTTKKVTEIINQMRDKERINIILRGLIPKLKTEVWRRMPLNPDY